MGEERENVRDKKYFSILPFLLETQMPERVHSREAATGWKMKDGSVETFASDRKGLV